MNFGNTNMTALGTTVIILFAALGRGMDCLAEPDSPSIDTVLYVDGAPTYLRLTNSASLKNIYSCVLDNSRSVDGIAMTSELKGMKLDVGQIEDTIKDMIRRSYRRIPWKSSEGMETFKARLARYLSGDYNDHLADSNLYSKYSPPMRDWPRNERTYTSDVQNFQRESLRSQDDRRKNVDVDADVNVNTPLLRAVNGQNIFKEYSSGGLKMSTSSMCGDKMETTTQSILNKNPIMGANLGFGDVVGNDKIQNYGSVVYVPLKENDADVKKGMKIQQNATPYYTEIFYEDDQTNATDHPPSKNVNGITDDPVHEEANRSKKKKRKGKRKNE